MEKHCPKNNDIVYRMTRIIYIMRVNQNRTFARRKKNNITYTKRVWKHNSRDTKRKKHISIICF